MVEESTSAPGLTADEFSPGQALDEIVKNMMKAFSAAGKACFYLVSSVVIRPGKIKHSGKMFLAAVLSTGIAVGVWVSRSPGNQAGGFVKWSSFRSYISQQLIISPNELDEVFKSISSAITENSQISPAQVVQLESALRSKFADNEIKLFPNPFYGSIGARPGEIVFTDVALDHPVYSALKPLLELGVPVADSSFKIRPYEKIRWTEWYQTVGMLAELLGIAKDSISVNAAEFMTNQDLRFALANLRRRFFLGGVDKLSSYSPESFASRFEAFSALASVVEELKSSR